MMAENSDSQMAGETAENWADQKVSRSAGTTEHRSVAEMDARWVAAKADHWAASKVAPKVDSMVPMTAVRWVCSMVASMDDRRAATTETLMAEYSAGRWADMLDVTTVALMVCSRVASKAQYSVVLTVVRLACRWAGKTALRTAVRSDGHLVA